MGRGRFSTLRPGAYEIPSHWPLILKLAGKKLAKKETK